jgi:hypothetical protein
LIRDLNLYRVVYNSKLSLYQYTLIPPSDYPYDIFPVAKRATAIFFLCHNKDPRRQLLTKYSGEEHNARKARCEKLIDFVMRRDLDRDYKKIYEKRMEEVWRLVNYDRSGNPV